MARKYKSDDIRQADLSGREYDDMNPEEQAEMKRRFQEFMSAIGANQSEPAPRKAEKKVQKWEPKQAFPKTMGKK